VTGDPMTIGGDGRARWGWEAPSGQRERGEWAGWAVIVVLASAAALEDIRNLPTTVRVALKAKVHPDGGLWVAARGREATRALQALVDAFGTRIWTADGWCVRKPQLALPGIFDSQEVRGNSPHNIYDV
jgi:hypothetical protein